VSGSADQSARADAMRVDVRRGAPTADELAAMIAVVTEAYAEETAAATADDEAVRSAWSLSQRSLRPPLHRHLGWGRFAG
jgi:hypothetical protein